MFVKKITSLAIICSLLVFGTVACGSSPTNKVNSQAGDKGSPVEITFTTWLAAEESTRQMMTDTISEFEKQNPDIKVKVVPIPVSDILNQLTIMNTAGNAPDITNVNNADGMSLAFMGAIEPVDNLLSQSFKADLQQSDYDLGLKDNQHYIIPMAGQPIGFWYNKKLMKDAGLNPSNPPKTLDELNKNMEIAKQKLPSDTVMLQLDTTVRPIGMEQEWSLMNAYGAVKDNKLQTSQMEPYANWLRDLFKKGCTMPGKKFGEFRTMAAQNRLLFGIDQPVFKGIVQSFDKSITDEKFNETWAVTTMPTGLDNKAYAVPENFNTAIFKSSKHKEAAVKLAEFLASSDYSLKNMCLAIGSVPSVKSAPQRFPKEFSDPSLKTFAEKILPTEVGLPWGPDYTKYATAVMTSMQEVITTDKPIPDILNTLETKLKEFK
ncbi:extracellular solute-binding protein [Desulfitobacterium sp. AusDCA]|uniref:extracellular solute-binding protein n=1 Tax=Desulfitobacterium sp. AusDCA TaxID=3240383 RepID=UPI003DA6F95C